jgi:phosphate uptake regulator
MKRKLVKQGNGSLTISLPKNWINLKNLTYGNEVEINELQGDIIISSEIKTYKQTISLTLNNELKKNLKNLLTQTYRQGIDVIELHNIDEETYQKITDISLDFLLGLEITNKTDTSCKLEMLSTENSIDHIPSLKRIFFIINEMILILQKDYKNQNFKSTKLFEKYYASIDRNIFFIKRNIMKKTIKKNDAIIEWEKLTMLMQTGHHIYYTYTISKNYIKLKDEYITELLETLQKSFKKYEEFYFNQNLSQYTQITELKQIYFKKSLEKIPQLSQGNDIFLSQINQTLRILQLAAAPVSTSIISQKIN